MQSMAHGVLLGHTLNIVRRVLKTLQRSRWTVGLGYIRLRK